MGTMNRYISLGFMCSLLLVSLVGICMATDLPSYAAYVQGGQSTITNGSDGMTVITVKDIIPYFHITDGNQSNLMPVEILPRYHSPLNTAIKFSGVDNESVSLISVSNLSYSDENKTLTLQVKPLEFYEGPVLKTFANEKTELATDMADGLNSTGIYIEMIALTPTNGGGGDQITIPNCLKVPC